MINIQTTAKTNVPALPTETIDSRYLNTHSSKIP